MKINDLELRINRGAIFEGSAEEAELRVRTHLGEPLPGCLTAPLMQMICPKKKGVAGDVWSVASRNPRLSSINGFGGWEKGTLLCLETRCCLASAASGERRKQ